MAQRLRYRACFTPTGSSWLDEDAMPAGTSLERGLLRGMQDSCGVVFLITPSFKDQGFLETEKNYAIQEKRRKTNKFAIVTLQFDDASGNAGKSRNYSRATSGKHPKHHLRRCEKLSALPVMRTGADWRDDVSGVVTVPKMKSTAMEVSEEGKAILNAAAASDGIILRQLYHGGQAIQAGRRALIPDQHPRTIAKWMGGLEDLQRRRYITDKGHKGGYLMSHAKALK